MKFHDLLLLCSFYGCQNHQHPKVKFNRLPTIYPEYQDVLLPVNIAPLNFKVQDEGDKWMIQIQGMIGKPITVTTHDVVEIPIKRWRQLLQQNQGGNLSITVSSQQKGEWYQYSPFTWKISSDSIDSHVAYRLIEPTYANWNSMVICQRELSSFKETEIISNQKSGHNCINCHTFNQGNPNEMIMHMRKTNAGTILIQGKSCKKLNTKTPHTISNFVYPDWHPSGKQIAFSTNLTQMSFYDAHPKIIEVYDSQSDIIIYDISKNEVYTSPLLAQADKLENFPFFSPDGKVLYFCTCDQIDSLPQQFSHIKYRICSIGFDPQNNRFSEQVDTLIDLTNVGKSITLPCISPNGEFIACSVAPNGCFSSWIPESDLYLYNIKNKTLKAATEWNSPEAESCTTWSSNSHWIIFSSRREDGIYNRLYIAHIDSIGNLSKPFLLPQKDPSYNQRNLKAYNLPRLIKGEVEISPVTIGRCAETKEDKSVRFNKDSYKPIIKKTIENQSEIN